MKTHKARGLSDRKLAELLSAAFNNDRLTDAWARSVNRERRYVRVVLGALVVGWFALATVVWG